MMRLAITSLLIGCSAATSVVESQLPTQCQCWIDEETQQQICMGSPIVIDLDGDGFDLTDTSGGVQFRLQPGMLRQWAWTASGSDDAWLARPGANGVVDDGRELFGDMGLQPVDGDTTISVEGSHGFLALKTYDKAEFGGNDDGQITSSDAVFSSLRLWRDVNHDGVSQSTELIDLIHGGISGLSLNYQSEPIVDEHGNEFRYSAPIVSNSAGPRAFDVWLRGHNEVLGTSTGSATTNNYLKSKVTVRCFTVLFPQPSTRPYEACLNGYSVAYVEPGFMQYGADQGAILVTVTSTTLDHPEFTTEMQLQDFTTTQALDMCVVRAGYSDGLGRPCETVHRSVGLVKYDVVTAETTFVDTSAGNGGGGCLGG